MGCEDLWSFIVGLRGIDYNWNRLNRARGQIRAGAFGAMCVGYVFGLFCERDREYNILKETCT